MSNRQEYTREEIHELIGKVRWYHAFEVAPGIRTPGICPVDAKSILDSYFDLPQDLTGKRVLEIGTWDGPYAFELERRGAEVVATDIQDPELTGFHVGRSIRNSAVTYVRTSVYHLSKNVASDFDIVLYMGVFYHLKHPLLALEQIHAVLRLGGQLLFEGEGFTHYAENIRNDKVKEWLLLALVANSDVPLALCYPGRYKKARNWYIPNVACVRSWLEATGFKVERITTNSGDLRYEGSKFAYLRILLRTFFRHRSDAQRIFGVSSKRDTALPLEHHLVEPV